MAPTNVGYSLKEAISHFFRNWTTSLGAVITIFLFAVYHRPVHHGFRDAELRDRHRRGSGRHQRLY